MLFKTTQELQRIISHKCLQFSLQFKKLEGLFTSVWILRKYSVALVISFQNKMTLGAKKADFDFTMQIPKMRETSQHPVCVPSFGFLGRSRSGGHKKTDTDNSDNKGFRSCSYIHTRGNIPISSSVSLCPVVHIRWKYVRFQIYMVAQDFTETRKSTM